MAGFTLASLAAAVSVDPNMLIVSRLAQGGFASIMVPQVLAIIHVSFPPEERAKAFGMFGTVAGLAALTGLSLGGLLVEWNLFGLEWRLVFLINVPVGLFGLILGQTSIVESKAPVPLRLDIIGAILAAVTLFLLVFPLIQGRELGWPAWGFVLLALTPVALFVFLRQQRARTRKDGSPLVALNLFPAAQLLLRARRAAGVQHRRGRVLPVLEPVHAGRPGLEPDPRRSTSLPFCIATFITSALSYAVLAAKMGRKLLQLGAVLCCWARLLHLGGPALRQRRHQLADGAAACPLRARLPAW